MNGKKHKIEFGVESIYQRAWEGAYITLEQLGALISWGMFVEVLVTDSTFRIIKTREPKD